MTRINLNCFASRVEGLPGLSARSLCRRSIRAAMLAIVLVGMAFWLTPADADEDTGEPAEPLWSADMTVVQYTSRIVGAIDADPFSNVGGGGDLHIKWLWHSTSSRELRLAFTEAVPDASSYTLQAGDLSLEFPGGGSGNSSFKWTGVDLDWQADQVVRVSVVLTSELDAEPVDTPAETPVNTPATGLPGISGTAQVGETLTADASGISDADGLSDPGYEYQWIAGGTDIDNATGSTYQLSDSEAGKTIQVRVSFSDDADNQEALTSAATAVVGAAEAEPPPAAVRQGGGGGLLVSNLTAGVSGSAGIQHTLDADRPGFAQAFTTGAQQGGYALGSIGIQVSKLTDSANAGDQLRVTINAAADGGGPGEPHCTLTDPAIFSAPGLNTFAAPAGEGACPQLAAQTIYFVVIEWLNPGETGSVALIPQTYSTAGSAASEEDPGSAAGWSIADRAHYLTVSSSVRTWTVYDETASFKIQVKGPGAENSPAAGLPAISGRAQAGQTLTADTSAISDADGLEDVSYSYQWSAGGSDIDGATYSTYELSESEVGKTVQVRVTFSDDAKNPESLTSAATALVAANPGPLTGFTLVDALVRPQTQLAALTDGLSLTLDDPASGSYGIRVNTGTEAEIGSVRLQLTGGANADQTEHVAPYSLYGDNGEQELHGGSLPAGSYTLTATAYSGASLGGDQLGKLSVSFTVAKANSPAEGVPTISGTAQSGQTLTADTSGISDADGLSDPGYEYQWIADGTDIDGATGPTYRLTASDVGRAIQVRVSFTDDAENQETLTSPATAAVAATVPTAPQGLNVTAGSQAHELDASWRAPASSGGAPVTGYRIQWKLSAGSWDDDDVSEATTAAESHTIAGLTGGVEYAVRVIARNEAGDGPPSIEASGTPDGEGSDQQDGESLNSAPAGLPTISGAAQSGQTLTADTSGISDADGLSDPGYEYQWIAGGTDIDGATGAIYQLSDSEVGKTIQVRVSFSDDAENQESLTSAATVAVAAATPLTVSTENEAQSHDGQTVFTFDLRFSEHIADLSYVTLRDHAFTVTGGSVEKAQRLDRDSATPNIRWRITVEPDGIGDVTIVLPATTNCDARASICTEDLRKLSNRIGLTVAGPGQ